MAKLLILEPFYGGSHQQLLDTLTRRLNADQTGVETQNSQSEERENYIDQSQDRIQSIYLSEGCIYDLVTLPAKKWHWRSRTSSLKLSQMVAKDHCYTTLLTSSVTSLAELLGLRPDLATLRKIVYFHENQLCYPVQVSSLLSKPVPVLTSLFAEC